MTKFSMTRYFGHVVLPFAYFRGQIGQVVIVEEFSIIFNFETSNFSKLIIFEASPSKEVSRNEGLVVNPGLAVEKW